MYVVNANLIDSDASIYLSTYDGVSGFSGSQKDAQRFGDRASALSVLCGLQGFRVVKLTARASGGY